jgi:5-methyltetrahydrofolate--homocysteine methyltransferase
VPYIDWTFFFSAWELKGRYPAILDDRVHGAAARDLFAQGKALLQRIVDGKLLRARGVYGFWPACAEGDDIVLCEPAGSRESGIGSRRERVRFPMLRQQEVIADDKPNRSLADFVAPCDTTVQDHVGAFAVTAGLGADVLVTKFEAAHDDYSAILVKALADRLAEAFAEYLHARARADWGIRESLSNDDLIGEKFQGIRPAFGYPACPDHSLKGRLFDLLGARAIGMNLTESCAMTPPASVSGLYFWHPEARYFHIQRVNADQAGDYARRLGVSMEEAEKWLRPVLSYEPALAVRA